jgi:O-glycosyl hydrolase
MKQKKLLSLLAIAAIVAMSCQSREEYFDKETTTPAEAVTLQLSPLLPNSIAPLSADGGTALDNDLYSLRYILEVWSADGATRAEHKVELAPSYTTPVTFSVNLPAKAYQFVFWADLVAKDSESDLIYKTDNTGGLQDIEWTPEDDNYAIADDRRDAYYAVEEIDLGGQVTKSVTLRRPLGKLRILATDLQAAITADVINTPVKASLTYTHADPPLFRKGFNAFTGQPTTATISATGALECVPVKLTSVTVEGATYPDAWLIAFDYFLPAGDLTAVSFDIQLYDDTQTPLLAEPKAVTNVPVGRNKLTTAIGPLFTYNADMTVSIVEDFGNTSVTKDPDPVLIPHGLQHAVAINNSAATLSWNNNPDAESYEIVLNGAVHTSTAPQMVIADADLAEEAAYTWKVRALKGGRYSEWSAIKTFQTGLKWIGPYTLTVAPENAQQVKGWGIYPGHALPAGDEENLLSINAALEARRTLIEDLGVNIIRLELRAKSGSNYTSGNKTLNTPYLDEMVKLINYAAERGVNQYLVSIWSPPVHMKEAYDANALTYWLNGHSYRQRLKTNQYDLFVEYVKDALLYLQSKGCPPPTALSLQNEPEAGVANGTGDGNVTLDRAFIEGSDLVTLAGKMRAALNSAGLSSVRIGAPESVSYAGAWVFEDVTNPTNIDIHIQHSYNTVSYSDNSAANVTTPLNNFITVKNRIGGESWQTEFSVSTAEGMGGNNTALQRLMLAMRTFSSDMVHAGYSVWMWWCGWFPGWDISGSQEVLLGGNGISWAEKPAMFEALATIFNNAPPGSHVRKVTTSDPALKTNFRILNDLVAFQTPNGGAFILLVNGSSERKGYAVSGLAGTTGTLKSMSGDNVATVQTSTFTVSGGEAVVVAPPNSVNFAWTKQ